MKCQGVGLCALVLPFLVSTASAFCSYFNYGLDSQQVVPPAQGILGGGWSELHLCDDDSLRGYIGLGLTETVTAVHIHGPAQPYENGPLLFELPLPELGYTGVLVGEALQYRDWFRFELCYADVHTVQHPEGALRGRIHPEIAVQRTVWGAVKDLFR